MAGSPVDPWELDFVGVGSSGDSLSELMDELTPRQQAQMQKALERLEKHGTALGPKYFEKVTGTDLFAFRHNVQDCEVRFLYRLVGRRFVMLAGCKKNSKKLPTNVIQRAEGRWKTRQEGK